jgi:hypothetical protein
MVNIVAKQSYIRERLYPEDNYAGQDGAVFTSFLSSARKAYPHLTFYRMSSISAWILVNKDDLYGVARITYEDARIRRTSKPQNTFNLYSRTICNPRVNDTREEYHLKKSSDSDKTIAAIGKWVKPLSPQELINLTGSDVSSTIYEFFHPLVRNLRRLRQSIGLVEGSPAERFMLNMGRSATTTLPPELQQVTDYLESIDTYDAMNIHKRQVHAVLIADDAVRVIAVPTRYRYDGVPDVITFDDPSEYEYTIYGHNEVPELYRNRINVLNITERMEFIPGVGIKHSDRVFYVVI